MAARFQLLGHAAYRPFRNVWMLEELQIAYDHVPCGPRSKEACEVNPFGKIPVLLDCDDDANAEDDDGAGGKKPFTIYESAAINTYLGDVLRKPESGCAIAAQLVPEPGTRLRGRYDQVINCLVSEMDAQGLWLHRKHSPDSPLSQRLGCYPDMVAHAQSHFYKTLRIQAADIKDGGYLLGGAFSAADIFFVHCCNWAEAIGWAKPWKGDSSSSGSDGEGKAAAAGGGATEGVELPGLALYLERCRGRPAYARAVAKKKQ